MPKIQKCQRPLDPQSGIKSKSCKTWNVLRIWLNSKKYFCSAHTHTHTYTSIHIQTRNFLRFFDTFHFTMFASLTLFVKDQCLNEVSILCSCSIVYSMRFTILGGGISGLSAAHYLSKLGTTEKVKPNFFSAWSRLVSTKLLSVAIISFQEVCLVQKFSCLKVAWYSLGTLT